jgi:hypothetical protein
MNIELKVKAVQINYLSEVFSLFGNMTQAELINKKRDTKVVISICIDIADKFSDKFKKISRSQNLFDEKKKYKFTLKYHEGYAIATYLLGVRNLETDPYKKMMATAILIQLEPQIL